MKKLFLALLIFGCNLMLSCKAFASKDSFAMKCSDVNSCIGCGVIRRCENSEVICYLERQAGLQCKFKN